MTTRKERRKKTIKKCKKSERKMNTGKEVRKEKNRN